MLATLTAEELAALSSIADDDLAPPPSQEDIFGKVNALKSQFQEDREKIARQLKENQVILYEIWHSQIDFTFS